MNYNLDDGIDLITPPLRFAWAELDTPDYGEGTDYPKKAGAGVYYVTAVLDPTETASTFRVNGEIVSGGQAAFLGFLESLDETAFELAPEDLRNAGEVMKVKSAKLSRNDSRREEGLMDIRFNSTETSRSGKLQKPTLADATGKPCEHPPGSITAGRCSVRLFSKYGGGKTSVIKFLKAVQILDVNSSPRGGAEFEPEEGYDAGGDSGFADETKGTGGAVKPTW